MEEKTFLYECSWCNLFHDCIIEGEVQIDCSCEEGHCEDNIPNAKISHGICKRCFAQELETVKKLKN